MKAVNFAVKLRQVQAVRGNNRALLLAPHLSQMPLPMQKYDDPFLPFGKAIINATRDLVCAYVFDLAAYLALGASGAVALERTIAYSKGESEIIAVLYGPFIGVGYAAVAIGFNADAITLVDESSANAYRAQGLGAFVVDAAGDLSADGLTLRLASESIIYAGRGDDFAEQARTALQGER